MKKLLTVMLAGGLGVSLAENSELLASCRLSGVILFNTCVVNQPSTPEQEGACNARFSEYMMCSTFLNLPEPMQISTDPDPYAWSRYDPCRYEVQHKILDHICPTLPIGK